MLPNDPIDKSTIAWEKRGLYCRITICPSVLAASLPIFFSLFPLSPGRLYNHQTNGTACPGAASEEIIHLTSSMDENEIERQRV